MALREIGGCEVCGNGHLEGVLDLGAHPLCDDLIPVDSSAVSAEYPIEILFCSSCITAHQRFQVPKEKLFPGSYHYRARFTADVLNGMSGLVDTCDSRFGPLAGKTVVDIGCNDGSLLDFFRAKGAKTVGIEPTDACADAKAKGHATFNDYLSEAVADAVIAAHGKPDVITFTNVFAHIEDLPAVLRAVGRLMGEGTSLVIENHYIGAVLEGNQFDTFYHEHPRTYSCTSFTHIARTLGAALVAVEFPARYGGNIRVTMRRGTGDAAVGVESMLERESGFAADFGRLRQNVKRWHDCKKPLIDELVARHGALRAKAFPGRAAILVKLLGLDARSIATVHEKPGSMKIGHYLPGTRIPIRSDDDLFADPDKESPILNLAWHISAEIHGYLREHGHRGPIVDVLEPADFQPRQ